MAIYNSKEKKQEIFKKFGASENDSGSVESQIAYFSFRVKELSNHLQSNQKDHSSRKALLGLVGKRKKMLKYLRHKDIKRYRDIIEKLGLRK